MSGFPSRSSFGARGGKPKIRPPRKPNPENTVKQMWERLAAGIKEIQNHNASSLSYEEHYRYAYNMVLYKNGDQLYSGVKQLIAEHLDHLAATLIVPSFPRSDPYLSGASGIAGSSGSYTNVVASESGGASGSGSTSYRATGKGSAQAVERAIEGDVFLKSVKGVWEDHTASMRKVQDILKYMDTHYTHSAGVPFIVDAGLHLFLLNIIRSPKYPIHSHLMHTILSQIQLERDGETIPRSTVRECVDILLRLSTIPPSAPAAGPDSRFGGGSSANASRAAAMTAAAAAAGNAANTVYAIEFEPRFMQRSAEFYEDEAEEGVERGDAAGYLRNVSRRLQEEADRTTHYLSPSTSTRIRELVISKLLTPHLEAILAMPNTGLRPMLDGDRTDELGMLYTLFVQVPDDQGRKALKTALKADIEERGKGINAGSTAVIGTGTLAGSAANGTASGRESPVPAIKQEPSDVDMNIPTEGAVGRDREDGGAGGLKGKGKAKALASSTNSSSGSTQAPAVAQAVRWVQDVLDLKDKFDRLLEVAFQGDKSIQGSINEAFQSFINAHQRAPEYLSLYIDEHLKKGSKAKSEDEIELALEKTITLFRFLTDRDKFEMYYKQHLSKRLLGGRSASDDAEKGMVAKLKVEMGFQFTQKLEGMFTDMRLSGEGANALRNYLNKKSITLPLDLSVSVLTTSHWPVQVVATSPLTLPPILQECTLAFEQYYDSRHSGRRLTWQGNQGTVDMRIRFKARAHEVSCSTQAACVLLCFDEATEGQILGYEDIKSRTALGDADLARTLQSLACGKFRILLKSPKGREISPTDKFAFNDGFTCPLAKFKIAMVAAKVESVKEKQESEGMVEEERRHQIEACIVRTMKNRKTMSHNDLVSEVAHQLSSRFSPSLSIIKKRIEGLIEREYLERDTEEIGRYRYLA